METFIYNWYLIVAVLALVAVVALYIMQYFKKPTADQIAQIKQWLMYAVLAAEKELGSGTGALKLRYVYDLFVSRWGWIAEVIKFETFSGWVDDALEQVEQWLKEDVAIAAYVQDSTLEE